MDCEKCRRREDPRGETRPDRIGKGRLLHRRRTTQEGHRDRGGTGPDRQWDTGGTLTQGVVDDDYVKNCRSS